MKNQMHTNFGIRFCLTLALASALGLSVHAQAGEPAPKKMMMTKDRMMEGCSEMKEKKEKMMGEMKAQDAALTVQIAEMNGAKGDKKLGLLSAIVARMAEERTAMNVQKAKMEEQMMAHMMQHMQMGKESMADCPMMKGMGEMGGKAAGAHDKHQEK